MVNDVAVLRGREKLLSLCHAVVRARESPSPGGAFPDKKCGWSCGRMTECLTGKNTEVEVLPAEGLFKESARYIFCGSYSKGVSLSLLSSLFHFSHSNLSINLKSSNSSILLPTNMRIALSQVCRCVTPECHKVGCCMCVRWVTRSGRDQHPRDFAPRFFFLFFLWKDGPSTTDNVPGYYFPPRLLMRPEVRCPRILL